MQTREKKKYSLIDRTNYPSFAYKQPSSQLINPLQSLKIIHLQAILSLPPFHTSTTNPLQIAHFLQTNPEPPFPYTIITNKTILFLHIFPLLTCKYLLQLTHLFSPYMQTPSSTSSFLPLKPAFPYKPTLFLNHLFLIQWAPTKPSFSYTSFLYLHANTLFYIPLFTSKSVLSLQTKPEPPFLYTIIHNKTILFLHIFPVLTCKYALLHPSSYL